MEEGRRATISGSCAPNNLLDHAFLHWEQLFPDVVFSGDRTCSSHLHRRQGRLVSVAALGQVFMKACRLWAQCQLL